MRTLLLLLGLLVAMPANAQVEANASRSGCFLLANPDGPGAKTSADYGKAWYCRGVIDTLMVRGKHLGKNRICPPEGATASQAALITLTFMASNPKYESLPLIYAASDALVEAWPCKE